MIAVAALALLAAPPPAAASPAGLYELHQMEMGGGLELQADGHFRYALSYGAVDEEAAGDWTFDGKTVRLTSNPMPKAPSFELVRDDPAPKGELYLTLEDPGFQWGHPLEAIASDANKHGFAISADDSGRVDLSGRPAIVAVAPEMPVYGPTGDVFPLSGDRGHRLLFRFHANDLGKARFDRQELRRDGPDLLMERYDTSLRFAKIRP
ncbi:MAG: hypothetical protein QOF34_307 [Sphingomonadales bacterium]|jgi:hypothetical protein|nr:hypothetical protein [Sphingomonadales bacterium]